MSIVTGTKSHDFRVVLMAGPNEAIVIEQYTTVSN